MCASTATPSPLKAPNPLRSLQCAEVLARLFNAPRAASLSDLLDKGDGLCVVCDRPVARVVVDCPACRGGHKAHTRDARCKVARCRGHQVEVLRAAFLSEGDNDNKVDP